MFHYTTLGGGEKAPVPSASELIEIVRRGPVWDEITIAQEDAQSPRASLSWHEGHGLILHCFEDDLSWGFFLSESGSLTEPEVDIVSIRVNDQYRICFVWRDGDADDVEIVDYH